MRKTLQFYAFACTLALAATHARAATETFTTWPTTTAFDTYTNAGWTLYNGEIRPSRGGYGTTLNGTDNCAWLGDLDTVTNAWLQTPLFTQGVQKISFWTRRNDAGTGTNVFELQVTSDTQNWTTAAIYTNATATWTPHTNVLNRFGNTALRLRKTADNAPTQFLGIDSVDVRPADAVILDNLQQTPASPTSVESVQIRANLLAAPSTSNVVLTCRYRIGTSGAFTTLPMAPESGATFRTTAPIPATGSNTQVQYYVQCDFQGAGQSPRFLPESGSNAPASYTTSNPYLATAPRTLDPSSRRTPLTITEIMYNPGADSESLEYIELFNTEPVARDISGYSISGSSDFTFPSNTTIAARSFLVIARDPAALTSHYGLANALGPLDADLPNDEATLRLRNKQDAVLLEVTYTDLAPWPKAPDGTGHALVLAFPDLGERDPDAWTWGAEIGGSPGKLDPPITDPCHGVVINEFLAHTDLPDVDFIELFNTTTQTIDLSLCTISDRLTTNLFTVPPGSLIPPRGFLAYSQPQLGYSLSKSGGDILLRNPANTRVLDALHFGAKANGIASGRYPDGTPNVHELTTTTFGTTNAPLLIRDIAINEIMFHPISGNDDDEYLELYNRGTGTVDLSNWRLEKGVSFTFPPGASISSHGFMIVARNITNLLARHAQLNAANTIGNYQGSLSDRGERIVVSMPDDPLFPALDLITIDDVTYTDGWGAWSDGGGSSLELIDPRSDNRRPSNWAGSVETNKAAWTTLEYTGTLANGTASASALNVMAMQAGEFLLDDVEVIVAGVNRISNPGFQSNLTGWTLAGTHSRSTRETTEGYLSTASLHIRASDQGHAANQISSPLSLVPTDGQTVTIRAKTRWLTGWPYLVLALNGAWLEAAGPLSLPTNLGSPGLTNSRAQTNGPPAVEELTHAPILPTNLQPVLVSCRVHDPDGIASVTLRYRLDPNTNRINVTMNDNGTSGDALARDGVYSGLIPGQAANALVGFIVETRDTGAPQGLRTVPLGTLGGEGLVRFGSRTENGVLATYNVWITAATLTTWNSRDLYSDEPLPATFVYGRHRAVYAGGVRYRGNSRVFDGPTSYAPANDPKTPNQARGAFSVTLTGGERLLGTDELELDSLGQIGRQYSLQGERHSYWIAEQLGVPHVNARMIHLRINESDRGALQDLQTPARDFAQSWSPTYSDARLFKLEQGEALANYTSGGAKSKARYRANWPAKRLDAPSDDFSTLYPLVDAFNQASNTLFEARASALIDTRDWLGYFAVNHIVGNEDSWGYFYPHNIYLEATPGHRARLFMYDMDWSLGFTGADFNDDLFRCDDPIIARFLGLPPFRRAYWRLMKEAAEGPLTAAQNDPVMDDWYAALLTNNAHVAYNGFNNPPYSPDQPSPAAPSRSIRGFVNGRRAYINTQLSALVAAPFAVTNNNGANFSTLTRVFTLEGSAPIHVETIRLNGLAQTMTWPQVTGWRTAVGLQPGANALLLEGYDSTGQLVGSDTITLTYLGQEVSPIGNIVINEIHYHPVTDGAEFVEIHNRSGSASFDLAGWRVNGAGVDLPGGTVIGPGEYRVLAGDLQVYATSYTNVELAIATLGGGLDDDGESLQLLRPLGSNAWQVVDEVRYADTPPWPTPADGSGPSLQLRNPALDNRRPGSWAAVTNAGLAAFTPGSINSLFTNLSDFANLWLNEVMPSNVTVTVDNVSEADPWIELYNDATTTLDLAAESIYLTDDLAQPERWPVPPGWSMSPGSRLLVWADAQTNQTAPGFLHANFRLNPTNGLIALVQRKNGTSYVLDSLTYDNLGPDQSYGSFPDGDPAHRQIFHVPTPGSINNPTSQTAMIRINEWMADNTRVPVDNSGGFFDWCELFNAGPDPVNLGGFHLTDDLSRSNKFTIPGGHIIDGYGFLIVLADDNAATNGPGTELHVNFKLSKNGDALGVFAPDGTLLDAVQFGPQHQDVSEGRWPDGDGPLYTLARPTPGSTNIPLRTATLSSLVSTGLSLHWAGQSGVVYQVDYKPSLTATNWSSAGTVTATSANVTFTAPTSQTQRFYRIRWDVEN